MNKWTILVKNTMRFIKQNSGTILTIAGSLGVVMTGLSAHNAGLKAREAIDEAKIQKFRDTATDDNDVTLDNVELTTGEKVRTTAGIYASPVIIGVATIASIVGSNHVNLKKQATLAGMYTMANEALHEYKGSVRKLIGQKKAVDAQDAVMTQRIADAPLKETEVIRTAGGDVLCFDNMSGRYFYSSKDEIERAERRMDKELFRSMSLTLNDFYYELGLPPTKAGDMVGWYLDQGKPFEVRFTSALKDGVTPALVIDYDVVRM